MKRAALLFTPFALTACATVPPSTVQTAALGQTVAVGPLRVKPTEIVEDSRCPTEVHCIWEQRVLIRAVVISPAGRSSQEFSLGEPEPVSGGRLTLTAINPPKTITGFPQRGDYFFTFVYDTNAAAPTT